MANHKRGRPKNCRAGCLLCKPHKANGNKGGLKNQTWQEQKARLSEKEQLESWRVPLKGATGVESRGG